MRGGKPVLAIRTILYKMSYVFWNTVGGLGTTLALPFKQENAHWAQKMWSGGHLFMLRVFGGMTLDMRNFDKLPKEGSYILACKHQSVIETLVFQGFLHRPCMIFKKEIMEIPVFKYYLNHMGMIGLDRDAGPKAMRHLLKLAKVAAGQERPLVIFPEGTRRPIDAEPEYLPGIYGLYKTLKLPVVPVAINCGKFLPRDFKFRETGTTILECLDPIEPGLDRDEFMARMIGAIESRTNELLQYDRRGNPPAVLENKSK